MKIVKEVGPFRSILGGYHPGWEDLDLADKEIRVHRRSIYNELLRKYYFLFSQVLEKKEKQGRGFYYHPISVDDEEKVINLYLTAKVRKAFYENQMNGDITTLLHDASVFVTFDGIKGAGKTELAKIVTRYFNSLDYSILEGKSGIQETPLKTSGFLGESIASNIAYHFKKVEEGERVLESSLELDLYTTQFKLALTKLAYELPPLSIVDRSFIGTFTKSYGFVRSKFKEIMDCAMAKEMTERSQKHYLQLLNERKGKMLSDEEKENVSEGIRRLIPKPWVSHPTTPSPRELSRFNMPISRVIPRLRYAILQYLIDQIKEKYVVPDLSVIMLVDKETSRKRQKKRQEEKGRKLKDIDLDEIRWYEFFRDHKVIPNALYIDSVKEKRAEQFRCVVLAIKERFEDKGTRPGLVKKITKSSIAKFYKANPLSE